MKQTLPLLLVVLVVFTSLGQKKDSIKIDTTKQLQIIPTPTSSNQSFPFLNVISPSPQAASLGKYGEIPVSLSSGTASFEVPIYEIISGSLKVPIRLSYHSSGIRVNDVASPVGSGWTLQAGGVITRTVKGGLWDECSLGILNQTIPEETDTQNFYCFLGNLNTTNDYVDGMPDDFFYNFNNQTGKFIYHNRSQSNQNITPVPVTYPYTKLKIDWVNKQYFVITDIDGTIYKFEALEETVLTQSITARNNPCGTNYTSGWYLTQIISANKMDVITFSYTSQVNITSSPIWSTTLTKEVNSYGSKTFNYSYAFQRSDVNSIFLSEINYKNGKVSFTYASDRQDLSDIDSKRLISINIFKKEVSGASTKLKYFTLNHSYFNCEDGRSQVDQPTSNITGHPNSFLLKRLKLDNVVEKDTNNISLPPYEFEYYQDYPLAIYGSLAQDYWGYSNGASSNTNLLLWNTDPTKSYEPSSTYGANCTPNFNYAVSGALKRIKYPTKGYTDFIYESNKAQVSNFEVEGGGIRIKKIVNHDNTGKSLHKTYNYVSSYITNIIYNGSIDDNIFNFTTTVNAEDASNNTTNCVTHTITVYPEKVNVSLGSETTFTANEIVEEYDEDSTGLRLGKKKYFYSVSIDPSYTDFPMERMSTSWKRGLLLDEKTYSILPNSTEVVVQEQHTTYTEQVQPYKTRSYFVRLSFDNDYYTGFCQTTGNKYCDKYSIHNQYVFAEKNEQSSVLLPTQTITNLYDQNGLNPVQQTFNYEYHPTHLQLTKTTSANSDGKVFEKYIRYPSDFSGNSIYDEMVNRHIFSPVVQTEEKVNGDSYKIISTNYKLWYPTTNFSGVSGFFAPLSVVTQEYGGPLVTELMMGEKLSNPVQNGYDLRARPVLYTNKSNLTTVLDWWDDSGKMDLVKRKKTNNLSTYFDYEATVGIKKITEPNGLQNFYFYDGFGRLNLTKDHLNNKLTEYEYLYGSPNQIITKQYRFPTTAPLNVNIEQPYTTIRSYFDGLGRPIQEVGEGLSPTGKDIVFSSVHYDEYGRESSKISIFPTKNTDGRFVTNDLNLAQGFYKDLAPYTTLEYEKSLLNRIKNNFGVGLAWRSVGKKTQMFDESAGNNIRNYSVDANGNISLNGYYTANSLYKKRQVNEQGNTSIEIVDKRGRIIQRQQLNGSDSLTTYYLYDDLGRVLAILQPEIYSLNSSISQGTDNWFNGVFFYKYDNRGRAIEKYIPNQGFTYNVYDSADRMVLSQDAHQRTLKLWSFSKYDSLSREVLIGELYKSGSRDSLQNLFNNHAIISEAFDATNAQQLFYSNVSFPFSVDSSNVIQVNYYDTYSGWKTSDFNTVETYYLNSTGIQTGVRKRYTQNKQWLTEAFYYNTRNRLIVHKKENILGNIEQIRMNHRFMGELTSYQRSYVVGNNVFYYSQVYEFDLAERRSKYSLFLNVQTPINIDVEYKYNEIGQLTSKKMQPNRQYKLSVMSKDTINRPPALTEPNTQDVAHKAVIISPGFVVDSTHQTYIAEIDTIKNSLTDALQTINYDYHIRGQLNCINCRNKQVRPNPNENDLFSMKLTFEDDNRYYDGNISQQTWKTPLVPKQQIYRHSYDNSSRLIKSVYQGGTEGSNFSLDTVKYDKNGNILQLKRHTIDNLNYTYNGNQILSVSDNGGTNDGFFDGNTSGTDYGYWANGSLKFDKNKGIDSVIYDSYLKKIKRIKFNNGEWMNFFYDGSGLLLKRKLSNGDEWVYRDDLIMKNGKLYQFKQEEGRVIYDSTSQKWLVEFEYRDHLGNLRLSFRDSLTNPVSGVYFPPVVSQIIEQDPFGLNLSTLSSYTPKKQNYTFNKLEHLNDFNLNIYNAYYRQLDPTIGRWWQVDSKPNPSLSLYSMMGNNPVRYADPLGDTLRVDPKSSKQFVADYTKAINQLLKKGVGKFIKQLENSTKVYIVKELDGTNSSFQPNGKGGTIRWNPSIAKETETNIIFSPATVLNHEFDHAAGYDLNSKEFFTRYRTKESKYENLEEKRVIEGSEQETARALGEIGGKQFTRRSHQTKNQILVMDPLSTKGTVTQPYSTLDEVIVRPNKN